VFVFSFSSVSSVAFLGPAFLLFTSFFLNKTKLVTDGGRMLSNVDFIFWHYIN
jgi:hypothetical protein